MLWPMKGRGLTSIRIFSKEPSLKQRILIRLFPKQFQGMGFPIHSKKGFVPSSFGVRGSSSIKVWVFLSPRLPSTFLRQGSSSIMIWRLSPLVSFCFPVIFLAPKSSSIMICPFFSLCLHLSPFLLYWYGIEFHHDLEFTVGIWRLVSPCPTSTLLVTGAHRHPYLFVSIVFFWSPFYFPAPPFFVCRSFFFLGTGAQFHHDLTRWKAREMKE